MSFPSKLIRYELLAPADTGSGGGESEVAADLAILNDEGGADETDSGAEEDGSGDEGQDRDTPRRSGKRTQETSEDQSEDDQDEDDEDGDETGELGDIDEDDEEGTIGDEEDKEQPAYARPPIAAIKEKYPKFFKDFPQLKAAFFGYSQFTEVFADVDSAREAAVKSRDYDVLEATLVDQGDPTALLTTLAENNPKALKRVVANFGEALRGVDPDVYIQLANPVIEELLYHANNHAVKIGNKNLQLAARHIANYVFANGGDIPDITKRAAEKAPSDAEVQLQEERGAYAKEKFQGALGAVIDKIVPDMNAILSQKLDGLTGFEKKQILKEARAEVDRILSNDRAFQASLRTLWKKAESTGYNEESKSRIKRAWLDRAKLIVPGIRSRLKQEALSSRTGSKSGESGESKVKFKVSTEKRTFPSGAGKTPAPGQRRVLDPKKIDWRKTSDRDILDM